MYSPFFPFSNCASLLQAIESGDLDGLKKAVADMKGSGGVPSDQCLNVCEMVPTESDYEYAVSLLAFAGYHVQKDMLTFLQSEKAGRSHLLYFPHVW